LITGGSGFIGSHLSERFLAEGYRVVALDNFITGSYRNIQHLIGNRQFEFIHHDISNPLYLPGEIDAVLHFASPASPIDYLRYPLETLRVGSYGTHVALELAREKRARFLMASTSEVYGDPLVHPQVEGYFGNVDTIGPRSVYDEAKRYAEAAVMAYHREFGLQTRIVRIFNTYGPRMRLDDGRVVPNFVGQALRNEPLTVYGKGDQTRCFQYVDDLVEGVYRLLNSDFVEPINIGTTEEMTILEFAEAVNEVSGNQADPAIIFQSENRIQGDPQTRRPNIERAKEILDWSPKVSLADGLAKTLTYFRTVV
jgi:dTDP-glucose 4,6-dehydratase